MTPTHVRSLVGLLAAALVCLPARSDTLVEPAPEALRPEALLVAAETTPLVARIEITGLKLIDEAVVREAMGLKVGGPFTAAQLQADVDALYKLGWFVFNRDDPRRGTYVTRRQDAEGNIEIIMEMVENPPVSGLRCLGASRQPTPAQLAAGLSWLKLGRPLNTDQFHLNSLLREIEAIYQKDLGLTVVASFPRAGATPGWTERRPDGSVEVNIQITERGGRPGGATPVEAPGGTTPGTTPGAGEPLIPTERLRVTAVEFRGLVKRSEESLRLQLETKPGQVYDPEQISRDMKVLYNLGYFYFRADRSALISLGYPVPAVNVPGSRAQPVVDADRRGVTVIFDLVENPVVSRVQLVGNTLFTSDQLAADLAFFQLGQPLITNADKLERDLERIRSKYAEKGYLAQVGYGAPQQNIDLLTVQPDGSVHVTLHVTELSVGSVGFEWVGAKRTKEAVFRAYMTTRAGQLFNYNHIQQDLNEIRRLDLLEDIRLLEPRVSVEDPSRLDLVYEVTEKRTGNISAGGGISSRFGLVGFVDISQGNLWGLAHRVSGRVEFGGRFNFTTNYFYPLLDGQGSEFTFRLYNTEDRTGATGIGAFTNQRANFDQTRRGGSVRFSRPITGGLRGMVQYELESVSTQRRGSALPNLPPFPFQDLGSDTTSAVMFGVTHDTRDFPLDATRGMYQSATIEIAGLGGDYNYGKYRLETRHYWPVLGGKVKAGRRERPAWVVATRGVYGLSSGNLPFSQAFFVGGSETLRGYEEDRFFGDRMLLFNLELRRQFAQNIQAVAFFDAGRAWRQGESQDIFADLASAVGIGVRVSTPVGPIRFDLGFGADGSQTHFSFGQPF